MYLSDTEKTYHIMTDDGAQVWAGEAFIPNTDALGYWERAFLKKADADALMFERYRGLPYELVVGQAKVVLTKMGDHRWFTIGGQGWVEVDVVLAYGDGYCIRDMGTIETVLQITNAANDYYDVHVRGKLITKVIHHSALGSHETTSMVIDIDNPVTRFFWATDRNFTSLKVPQ